MRFLLGSFVLTTFLSGCGGTSSNDSGDGVGGGTSSGGMSASGGSDSLTGGAPAAVVRGVGSGGAGNSGGSGGGSSPSGPLVMGYILDLEQWGGSNALTQLDFSAVDYVIHAFYTANDQDQLVSVDPMIDTYRNAGLVTRIHEAGKRVVMSLGGANHSGTLKQVAANSSRTTAFVANVVARINEYGYDGVDLDMEFPAGGSEPQQQLDLMTALYAAVKVNNPAHLVMFGVSPGYYLNQFKWAELGAHSDYAFYFCYDWDMPANGPMKNPGTSFNMLGGEPLGEASCSAALNYMLAGGYPAQQIVVGLPFYANGDAHYSSIPGALKSATPHADYMEVSDGSGGWWPTASSTVMKIDAVLDSASSVLTGQATVGGVGYWEWGYEDPATPNLSQAIKQRVIDTR